MDATKPPWDQEKVQPAQMSAQVSGYKPQSPEKIELVNKFKALEKQLGELYIEAQFSGLCDPRSLANGKTQAQQAFMWLNRAVFQPTDFFMKAD